MYKIGEFSALSKTTIKTLRYYEKEKLLIPAYIDKYTGYRYYETKQLIELSKIISLRQIGLSIKDIKRVQDGWNMKELLEKRKNEIEENINTYNIELSKINYLLEGKNMNNEIIFKELPGCIVYYKEGVIKDYSEIVNFILSSGDECLAENPNIKCVTPDYCFVNYLDGEFKEKNIKIRYAQAVTEMGKENKTIKFMELKPVNAVCIYHKGAYENLGKSYSIIMKYIEENNYEIIDFPRECYIDGMWNKDNVEEWLTEIQVPVKKKK
ncbi:MAG: MerR family transcriptional regulator [Clostridia bacterium]